MQLYLTNDEVRNIKISYQIIMKNSKCFANHFYDCLFEFSPLLKPMFKKKRSIQELHFMELLNSAISNINRPQEFDGVLKKLGRDHKKYGVEVNHFTLVKSAFMLALEHILKGKFARDVECAWSNYFDRLAAPMICGLCDK